MKSPIAAPSHDEIVKVIVEGRAFDVVREIATIDLDDLTGEVQKIGGDAIWWAVLAAKARKEHRIAKMHAAVVEAEQAKEHRRALGLAKERVTEKMIEEAVALDKQVQQAEQDEIDAEERVNILTGVHSAVEQKQRTLNGMSLMLLREQNAVEHASQDAMRDVIRDRLRGEPRGRSAR